MPQLLRTDSAESDLIEIADYIRQRSGSIEVALRFLDKVDQKCRLYAGNPELGERRDYLGPTVREFPLDSFVVLYEPMPDGIVILMVTRGARKYEQEFRRRLKL